MCVCVCWGGGGVWGGVMWVCVERALAGGLMYCCCCTANVQEGAAAARPPFRWLSTRFPGRLLRWLSGHKNWSHTQHWQLFICFKLPADVFAASHRACARAQRWAPAARLLGLWAFVSWSASLDLPLSQMPVGRLAGCRPSPQVLAGVVMQWRESDERRREIRVARLHLPTHPPRPLLVGGRPVVPFFPSIQYTTCGPLELPCFAR